MLRLRQQAVAGMSGLQQGCQPSRVLYARTLPVTRPLAAAGYNGSCPMAAHHRSQRPVLRRPLRQVLLAAAATYRTLPDQPASGLAANLKAPVEQKVRDLLGKDRFETPALSAEQVKDLLAYLHKWLPPLLLDHDEGLQRYIRQLANTPLSKLKDKGQVLEHLVAAMDGSHFLEEQMRFSSIKTPLKLPRHMLRIGDVVTIVSDDHSPITAEWHNISSGTITDMKPGYITVCFARPPAIETGAYGIGKTYRMDQLTVSTVALERTLDAMEKMFDPSADSLAEQGVLPGLLGTLINRQPEQHSPASTASSTASSTAGSSAGSSGADDTSDSDSEEWTPSSSVQFKPPPGLGTDGMPKAAVSWAQGLLPAGNADPDTLVQQQRHLQQECASIRSQYGLQLDPTQLAAIALTFLHKVVLLQGPPGTGKTCTIVNLLVLLIKKFRFRGNILVCAQTNTGVDNQLEGAIKAGLKVVRVGHPARVGSELNEHTLKYLVDQKAKQDPELVELIKRQTSLRQRRGNVGRAVALNKQLEVLGRKIRQRTRAIELVLLEQAEVVGTTCITAGGSELHGMQFDVMIMDEASQCPEPQVLIPIMREPKRLVLVGDHKQLPPVVQSKEAVEAGLGISLFERLMEQQGVANAMLQVQYRMHPALSKFPSIAFYGGRLTDGVTTKTLTPPAGIFPDPCFPVLFIDVEGLEETNANESSYNAEEVEEVVVQVQRLIDADVARRDIGVITPYNAQKQLLYQGLHPWVNGKQARKPSSDTGGIWVDVKTVHGYQGREKAVMVLSTVRANEESDLGHAADERLMNVALTRAKRGLIVIGNKHTLQTNAFWLAWLEWVESGGA